MKLKLRERGVCALNRADAERARERGVCALNRADAEKRERGVRAEQSRRRERERGVRAEQSRRREREREVCVRALGEQDLTLAREYR